MQHPSLIVPATSILNSTYRKKKNVFTMCHGLVQRFEEQIADESQEQKKMAIK